MEQLLWQDSGRAVAVRKLSAAIALISKVVGCKIAPAVPRMRMLWSHRTASWHARNVLGVQGVRRDLSAPYSNMMAAKKCLCSRVTSWVSFPWIQWPFFHLEILSGRNGNFNDFFGIPGHPVVSLGQSPWLSWWISRNPRAISSVRAC